jgi:hypothetical protein
MDKSWNWHTYVTSLWTAVSCQDIRMVQLCAVHSWTLLDKTAMASSYRPQCQLLTSWTYPSSTATGQVRGVPAPEHWCPHCAATRQVLRWTAPVAHQHLWQKRKCITGHNWTSWKSQGTPLRCNYTYVIQTHVPWTYPYNLLQHPGRMFQLWTAILRQSIKLCLRKSALI